VKVIVIFSLPRSGSTLLQRILATSPRVATAPETWLLLPFLGARAEGVVYATYSSKHSKMAIDEFVKNYVGEATYMNSLRIFFMSTYSAASKGKEYFVEKTPRNLLFARDIIELFGSDAKPIFLTRNPVAIAASMIATWGKGVWNIDSYEQDFFECLGAIIKEYNPDLHLLIKYEDLTAEPSASQRMLENYLGLNEGELDSASIKPIVGRMGDPTGQFKYDKVMDNADEWILGINTYTKKIFYKRLVRKIGRDAFDRLNYDYEKTYSSIVVAGRYSVAAEIKDLLAVFKGFINKRFQLRMLRLLGKRKVRSILS